MNAQEKKAQARTDWAEDRTAWAEDRTILAAERTFAGWVRTGLTILVVAIALQGVFGPAEPTWLPKAVATMFIVAALLVFVAAWFEARVSHRNFTTHGCRVQPMWRVTMLSIILGAATVLTGVVLWLL